MEKELIHKHLLIRAEVKKPLATEEDTVAWMKKLINKIDMNILAGPYSSRVTKKGNKGLSGVAIIDTSHIGIHTWDEPQPALVQLDVYSCKEYMLFPICSSSGRDFTLSLQSGMLLTSKMLVDGHQVIVVCLHHMCTDCKRH